MKNQFAVKAMIGLISVLAGQSPTSASTRWVTHDFFIGSDSAAAFTSSAMQTRAKIGPASCRDHIREVMCLVDPLPAGTEPTTARACLPGGEAYAGHFERLYDTYPPALQRMFCSFTRIHIEREFFGTAYGGVLRDRQTGAITGAQMGIRKSLLDEDFELEAWATWKEQLSYGGNPQDYTIRGDLPRIETPRAAGVNGFLYFVIAHEIGHVLDFTNHINRYSSDDCAKATEQDPRIACEMHPQSWGALTWITDKLPKPEHDFAGRPGLCFYWCEGNPLPASRVPEIYAGLDRSSFLSIYATTQPWDDFADSLAYSLLADRLRTSYVLDTRQGARYDILAKLDSKVFASKRRYLRELLARTDIKYP